MKKMMESRIPNIDVLVANAGRQEWISQAQSQQLQQQQFQGSAMYRQHEQGAGEVEVGEEDDDLHTSKEFSQPR